MGFTKGALVEPMSVGYHALHKLNPKLGSSLLITGAGPIGISCMVMARLAGIVDITITDIDDFRLGIAGDLGASSLINVNDQNVPEKRYDCAIEASGAQTAFAMVLQGIKKGGHVSFVGMSNAPVPMNLNLMLKKEALITGIYRYVNSYKPVLNILDQHKVDLSRIITHRFGLGDLSEAVKIALDPDVNSMKIIIES
jgi:L-iditol 2-dehydrogenase